MGQGGTAGATSTPAGGTGGVGGVAVTGRTRVWVVDNPSGSVTVAVISTEVAPAGGVTTRVRPPWIVPSNDTAAAGFETTDNDSGRSASARSVLLRSSAAACPSTSGGSDTASSGAAAATVTAKGPAIAVFPCSSRTRTVSAKVPSSR